ncbi:acyl-CoA synthetase [Streptomyces sp. NPDC003314]
MRPGTGLFPASACLDGALMLRRTPFGRWVRWADLALRGPAGLLALLPPELPFETSGSTGTPVVWWRSRAQLLQEAEHIAALLEPERPDAFVVHAPLRHLYGLLFGALVPALLEKPARYVRATDPLPAGPERPLHVAVPSTWWQLRHSGELTPDRPLTVVHSTGPLPGTAAAVRRALPRLRLYEVHGATETGMIGTRTDGAPDWELAPDVSFAGPAVPGHRAPLSVHSPRLARRDDAPPGQRHVLDDLVEVTGPRSYRLVGRLGGLLKINGRRADLSAVETALRAAVPDVVLRCVLVPDEVRGEWYEVHVDGGETARNAVAAATRALPDWQVPRAVRTAPLTSGPGRTPGPTAPPVEERTP